MTISNARPTMISQSVLAHLEREGVFVNWRQKQIITALFDPNVGPDLVDHLLGPQPWIKYATCDVCGQDIHIKRGGSTRKHQRKMHALDPEAPGTPGQRVQCEGSGTTRWHI